MVVERPPCLYANFVEEHCRVKEITAEIPDLTEVMPTAEKIPQNFVLVELAKICLKGSL